MLGGNVVIPSFAVGRTQEMLYFIREIKEKNLLPEFPHFDVYVDSPLAIEATSVFTKNGKSDCDLRRIFKIKKRGKKHGKKIKSRYSKWRRWSV